MNNEFGYIYPKPFKKCDSNLQVFSTISIDDDKIEFKANESFIFSAFGKGFLNGAVYVVDSRLNAITAINTRMTNSTWSAISHSTINSAWFFINKSGLNEKQKIIHFTEKTKIRSLHYYNDNIFQVFYNDSIEFQYSLRHSKLTAMKMSAHNKKDELIGRIDENTSVFLNKNLNR